MFGLFDKVVNKITDEVKEFADSPLNYTADKITQPVRDAAVILSGLSEGELRTKAILRFGADAVVGMGSSELIGLLLS